MGHGGRPVISIHRGVEKWLSRRLHASKIEGSNPSPAIMLHINSHIKIYKARQKRAFLFELVTLVAKGGGYR